MGQTISQSGDQFLDQDTEAFLPPAFSDDSRPGQGSGKRLDYLARQGRFKHPMAALFHVLFKSLALLFYLFGGLFGQEFISTFVTVILLISMDFWVVKNVTGRLLVGLRWSNFIDEEGNSHWSFENKSAAARQADARSAPAGAFQGDDENEDSGAEKETTSDSTIFWTGLIMAPTLWVLLVFVSIFKLNVQGFMLVTLASILSLSNLFGYVRCRLGTSEIKSSITQFVAKQVFLNYFTPSTSTGPPSGSSAPSKPMI